MSRFGSPRFGFSRSGFRIGLSHKILAIGAVGTAGLLLVAAVYFMGTRSLASYQKTSDDAAAMGVLMDKVGIELLQLRQHEKNFLIQGLQRFADRHNDTAASTRRNLATLKEKLAASGHPNLVSKTDAVGGLVDEYVSHFRALVEARKKLGLDQDSGLEGKLRASVGAIESELDKFDDTRLVALVLTLRHHEKDFMLRRDPKALDEMKKTAGEMAMAIRIATIPARTKEVFAERLEAYQRDFAAYVEAAQVVAREQRAMVDAYNKVDPELDAIVKRVDAVNTEAHQAAEETRAATTLSDPDRAPHPHPGGECALVSDRSLGLEAAGGDDGCDAQAWRRRFRRRPARARPQGRDRRYRRRGRGVQGECHGEGQTRSR